MPVVSPPIYRATGEEAKEYTSIEPDAREIEDFGKHLQRQDLRIQIRTFPPRCRSADWSQRDGGPVGRKTFAIEENQVR